LIVFMTRSIWPIKSTFTKTIYIALSLLLVKCNFIDVCYRNYKLNFYKIDLIHKVTLCAYVLFDRDMGQGHGVYFGLVTYERFVLVSSGVIGVTAVLNK